MQLPTRTASPKVRAVFAHFVARQLVREGMDDLAAPVGAATRALTEAARARSTSSSGT